MNKEIFRTLFIAVSLTIFSFVPAAMCKGEKPKNLNIGTILGLTGKNASYGQKMQQGFELAIDEINSSGGIKGRRIHLIIEDHQFSPQKAISAYQRLVGVKGVHVIVGITGSSNALPVCEASKDDDIVIIDPLGSAPKLTTHGGPNYFRIMASETFAGRYIADWAIENGMKHPAIVYAEDDWGVSYKDTVVQYLKQKGFANVPSYGSIKGMRDFRTQVEKLRENPPDAIFLLLYPKEGATFMQNLKQGGVRASVYGTDNLSASEFVSAGSAVVEGVHVAMPAPTKGTASEAFVTRYRKKYKEDPDASVMKSYDAMKLALRAIKEAGEIPSKIKKYLRKPSFEYKGIAGSVKFDTNGDLVSQEFNRLNYRAGELLIVK